MRYKEITETPYLKKTLQQFKTQSKTGAPMPANKLPKGPIKSPVKNTIKQKILNYKMKYLVVIIYNGQRRLL